MANFYFPRFCGYDFLAKINVRMYKEFDRENRSGSNFTALVVIYGQIPYKSSNSLSS